MEVIEKFALCHSPMGASSQKSEGAAQGHDPDHLPISVCPLDGVAPCFMSQGASSQKSEDAALGLSPGEDIGRSSMLHASEKFAPCHWPLGASSQKSEDAA